MLGIRICCPAKWFQMVTVYVLNNLFNRKKCLQAGWSWRGRRRMRFCRSGRVHSRFFAGRDELGQISNEFIETPFVVVRVFFRWAWARASTTSGCCWDRVRWRTLKLRKIIFEIYANSSIFYSLIHVVSSFWLMTSSKTARVNKPACVSSQVHICVTEYWQLIRTSMCANLSE